MTILRCLPTSRFSRASFAYTLLFLCVIIYFEFIQVWTNSYGWSVKSSSSPDSDIRILIVADPQLLGEHGELPFVGILTRLHADRYIAQNYKAAKHRTKPHVVIFLGDLLDEGSTATDQEAARYLQRFHSVFRLGTYSERDSDKAVYIYLPGDNDVGGEGLEKISSQKVHWFNSSVGDLQSPVLLPRELFNIKFSKVNFIFENTPEYLLEPTKEKEITGKSTPTLNFALSHYPCMQAYPICSKLIQEQKPNLILSSHTHKSTYYQYNSEGKVQYLLPSLLHFGADPIEGTREAAMKMGLDLTSSSLRFDLKNSSRFHEVVTPTCSYRMGEKHVGFGLLTINNSGEYADYQVLWLPNGFKPLFVYIAFYVISKIIFTPWVLWKLLRFFWPKLKRFLGIHGDSSKAHFSEKAHLV